MKNEEKIYFDTTHLNLAVYLHANGKQVVGINPEKEGQKKFTFIKSDSLEELVFLYKYGDGDDDRLLVPIRKYEQSRRELLDKLNN